MLQLRPYQEDMIDSTREALKTHQSVLLQAPTGAGKTAITVFMMGRAAERDKTAFFLVHQNELLSQTSKALWKQKLEHGMVAAGKVRSKLPTQVASVQTLVRRLAHYEEPSLVIIDEAHRSAAATYAAILKAWPNCKVIGLTATPQRTDGKPLDSVYQTIVEGPSIRQLMDSGYLCDYEMYGPPVGADLDGIKRKMGDYDKQELEQRMDKPTITGNAVHHYLSHAKGKRCVVMCVSIKHAEHVVAQYIAAGVPAAVIEGRLTSIQRERMLEDFAAGRLMVLCNVQLMVEGVDIPAIEVIQWLRPTQSLVIWMQGNGRGLRPHEGKSNLIIFDHVGNHIKHGLPDDDREWSLEGKDKKSRKAKDEDEVKVKQCGSCWAVFRPGPPVCPQCGAPVAGHNREIEVVDGKLEKVDRLAVRKQQKREQGAARTLEELVALGVRRGMNKPSQWAAMTYSARLGQKPTAQMFKRTEEIYRSISNGL